MAAKLLLILALLAGVWWHGRSSGADAVQARWDADTIATERAQQAQEAAQRRRATAASADYQAKAARRAASNDSIRADLGASLAVTACPKEPNHEPMQLADLPIPGAALDRLRRAGADAID